MIVDSAMVGADDCRFFNGVFADGKEMTASRPQSEQPGAVLQRRAPSCYLCR
jgi:hypothetical protein